eukprot:scaffold56520_cov51-Phaeocystis_antarctica.AAC.5
MRSSSGLSSAHLTSQSGMRHSRASSRDGGRTPCGTRARPTSAAGRCARGASAVQPHPRVAGCNLMCAR